MNTKRVNFVLNQKHKEFVKSIKNKEVRDLIDKNSIITGGSIVSLLLNEKVNDFDYYFTDKDTTLEVAKYFINLFEEKRKDINVSSDGVRDLIPQIQLFKDGKLVEETTEFDRIKIQIKSAGAVSLTTDSKDYNFTEFTTDENTDQVIEHITHEVAEADKLDSELLEATKEKDLYTPVFITQNAITLTGNIQLVTRFFGDPKDIHKNFDYIHCTNYWLSKNKTLYLSKKALACIIAKELKYVGSKYPICSLFRARKFIQKGWSINAGQILKICLQVSKLNLEDYSVLEDQLTGVDTAYFDELLRVLKERQDKETVELPRIESGYLATLVDRIF